MIFDYFKEPCEAYLMLYCNCFVVIKQVLKIIVPVFCIAHIGTGGRLYGCAVYIGKRPGVTIKGILAEVKPGIKPVTEAIHDFYFCVKAVESSEVSAAG